MIRARSICHASLFLTHASIIGDLCICETKGWYCRKSQTSKYGLTSKGWLLSKISRSDVSTAWSMWADAIDVSYQIKNLASHILCVHLLPIVRLYVLVFTIDAERCKIECAIEPLSTAFIAALYAASWSCLKICLQHWLSWFSSFVSYWNSSMNKLVQLVPFLSNISWMSACFSVLTT